MAGFADAAKAIGTGFGGMALLDNFNTDLPKFNNPATAAQPYLDRIPDTLKPFFQNYINQGKQVDPVLQNQYTKMSANPGNFLTSLANSGGGYTQSPGYQFRLNEALGGANNAAAAGGMLGSPQNREQDEKVAEGLASQDYETWLNHLLGIFGGGQHGLEGESERGYTASTGYGNALGQALTGQGELAGFGAAEQNRYNQEASKAKASQTGDIIGGISKFLPALGAL